MLVESIDNADVGTMTIDAAARRLGIGRQLAYDLANQGRLPGALRLGRRFVVSRKILEEFLAGVSDPPKVQIDPARHPYSRTTLMFGEIALTSVSHHPIPPMEPLGRDSAAMPRVC